MKRILLVITVLVSLIYTSCKKQDVQASNLVPNDPSNPVVPASLSNVNRPLGASANEILSASKYRSIKIELQYMAGTTPDQGAISNLVAFLQNLVNKPDGISVVTRQIPASSSGTLTVDQIKQVEKANRTIGSSGTELGIYLLYTNGYSSENDVIGMAYMNTSMVMFGKNITDHSSGATRTLIESAVMEHEFGHIMGLVNITSPMQVNHNDPAHPNHCNNSNCLMYWVINTSGFMRQMVTARLTSIPTYDANCLADLHANGGK